MSNELVQYSIPDIERMAKAMANSKLLGVGTPEQAMTLMLIAQAEGRHPALAAQDYHIISVGGITRPSKKAEAMLRDFLASGGKVEWHELNDTKADATFSHPSGGSVRIDWDMERAKTGGVLGNPTWKKFPRAMLRSRVISEGIRTVCPGACSGMYEPEETKEIVEQLPPMKDITPPASKLSDVAPIDESLEALKQQARDAAGNGGAALDAFLQGLPKKDKVKLVPFGDEIRATATQADIVNSNQELEGNAA